VSHGARDVASSPDTRPMLAKVWRKLYISSSHTRARFANLSRMSRHTLLGFIGWAVRVEKSSGSSFAPVRFRCSGS